MAGSCSRKSGSRFEEGIILPTRLFLHEKFRVRGRDIDVEGRIRIVCEVLALENV